MSLNRHICQSLKSLRRFAVILACAVFGLALNAERAQGAVIVAAGFVESARSFDSPPLSISDEAAWDQFLTTGTLQRPTGSDREAVSQSNPATTPIGPDEQRLFESTVAAMLLSSPGSGTTGATQVPGSDYPVIGALMAVSSELPVDLLVTWRHSTESLEIPPAPSLRRLRPPKS